MDQDRIYKRSENIIARQIAGETLLVPIQGQVADMQKVFSLNKVAQCVWELLDGTNSVNDICGEVMSQYGIAQDVAEKDVTEFVTEMLEHRLVQDTTDNHSSPSTN